MFRLGLALVVFGGIAFPAAGAVLAPGQTALLVAVLALISFTLPFERLRTATANARGLAVAAAAGFVLMPLLCTLAAHLTTAAGGDAVPPGVLPGFVVLGALPTTLATATVCTRLARGNDALSLVWTVVGTLASVALLPAIVGLVLGRGAARDIPLLGMAWNLFVVVVLPVAAGQLLRIPFHAFADARKPAISAAAQVLVLAILLIATSKLAPSVRAAPAACAGIALLSAGLHVAGLVAARRAGRMAGLPDDDAVAAAFGGSQKSIFVGVHVLTRHFPADPAALLPVTTYHVAQLVIDTYLAERRARRAAAPPESR
ncbi:MAG: hypothetical protein HMLKMBBP_01207 [Planctomycetes bacterium]|nr:hypothetical protein [Planctomycetota bacterium]